MQHLLLDTVTLLAQAIELRDQPTGRHSYKVGVYSVLLAEHLGLNSLDIDLIRWGAPLHDVGIIGIDDAILRKPDRLTPEEFEVMKQHTVRGAEIVQPIPALRSIMPIVRSHHERWDGEGYPDGLVKEAISPLARVVAVADAFDSMTSHSPYRRALPAEYAFAEIEKHAGTQFDPEIATAFLRIRPAILAK